MREVRRLGYRPTQAARSLRVAKQWAIGLLIVDDSGKYLADYLTSEIVAALSRTLNDHDYNLMVRLCRSDEISNSTLFRRLTVDGVVIFSSGSADDQQAALKTISSLGLPIILLQAEHRSDIQDCLGIRQDDRHGGKQIGLHLAGLGVKKIVAIITEVRWTAFEARVAGLQMALAEHGNATDFDLLRVSSEEASILRHEITEYLDNSAPVDAIFGGNDAIALAAILALRDRGLSVPEDVYVTGFNKLDFVGLFGETLTTVVSRGSDIGYQAAQAMVDRISSGAFPSEDLVLPLRLETGASTRKG